MLTIAQQDRATNMHHHQLTKRQNKSKERRRWLKLLLCRKPGKTKKKKYYIVPDDVTPIQQVPIDVLIEIMSYSATCEEVFNCLLVSQFFAETAISEGLWRVLAYMKYGTNVADDSIHLYRGCWKDMVQDDNRKGACPTLRVVGKPRWYFVVYPEDPIRTREGSLNRTVSRGRNGFQCFVKKLQLDRSSDTLRVYIHARGWPDMPHPLGGFLLNPTVSLIDPERVPCIWNAVVDVPGHYQGYLTFPMDRVSKWSSCEYWYGEGINFAHPRYGWGRIFLCNSF